MSRAIAEITRSKKGKGSSVDREQVEFNKLRKKIEALQKELKNFTTHLDACLRFYHAHVCPKEKALAKVLTDSVKLLYDFAKTMPRLSSKERSTLHEWILHEINQVFNLIGISDVDPQLHPIFEELNGSSAHDIANEEFFKFKDEMMEIFQKEGIDLDLSALKGTDNQQEVAFKFFEALEEAKDKMGPEEKIRPQLTQRELKQQEQKEIQKKSIGAIYKHLVKAVHPDLEQDPSLKASKEEMMKKVTVAYENDDLYTLLQIEMEWMNRSANRSTSPEQFKIYNAVLKDQVDELRNEINVVRLDPKYFPLQRFVKDSRCDMSALQDACQELEGIKNQIRVDIQKLKGPHAKAILRNTLIDRDIVFF